MSGVAGRTATGTTPTVTTGAPGGRSASLRPTGRSLFFAVVLVVLAVYTQQAFGLEWRTAAGRIGPGFFPRIVGLLGLAIALFAFVRSLLPGATDDEEVGVDDDEAGEADLGRHPVPMAVVVAASVGLLLLFTTLGAIVASAIFLAAVLFYLNRPGRVLNIAVSLLLPVAVYVLFQSLLNAGLPEGILPRF